MERVETWSRAWLAMWVASSVTTLAAAFLLPPKVWALVVSLLFGIPESIALMHRGDRYPPLTYVTAYYLPRWLTMTLIGFLTGAIGASWLGVRPRWMVGLILGLFAWSMNHFDVTYSSRARWLDRKRQDVSER